MSSSRDEAKKLTTTTSRSEAFRLVLLGIIIGLTALGRVPFAAATSSVASKPTNRFSTSVDLRLRSALVSPSFPTDLEMFQKQQDAPAPPDVHLDAPKIIIMGGPASGKGTQCEYIQAKYNVIHLSTGDMLREAVAKNSDSGIGAVAKACMERGELVPDDVIIQIVLERISRPDCVERGWLLDGFPRTVAQAEALARAGIRPDLFLFLDVPDQELIRRVVGRRMDPVTGKIYHTEFKPPPKEIVTRLVQRADDTREKMVNRLLQFHQNVESVRRLYEDVLVQVDGSLQPEQVATNLFSAIDSMRRRA